LGFPVFDEFKKPTKKDILECKGKDAVARGEYNEEGLVVFEGSKCNLEETPTAGQWIIGMRNRLKIDKVLIQEKNTLVFTSNYLFNSPSAAAGVVLARRANGWIEWKYENGKTLDEEKRQKV